MVGSWDQFAEGHLRTPNESAVSFFDPETLDKTAKSVRWSHWQTVCVKFEVDTVQPSDDQDPSEGLLKQETIFKARFYLLPKFHFISLKIP